jgi:quercetin dioxygenase-like cupin family protein
MTSVPSENNDLTMRPLSRFDDRFRWDAIPVLAYKEEPGTHFRQIARQVLFGGHPALPAELRYFEIDAGGHSTLERHRHVHVVVILRGRGRALVGDQVHEARAFDVIRIAPSTWHQFRATYGEPLGFLCMVAADRDRPEMPDAEALAQLRGHSDVAEFIRV